MKLASLFVLASISLFGCASKDPSPSPGAPVDSAVSVVEAGGEDTFDAGRETPPPGCTTVRDSAIGPIDKVTKGTIKVISDTGGVKTVVVDAVAGGFAGAKDNPWIFVKLSDATRVDVTDKSSLASTEWDLALKRAVLYTNSGDGGPGGGGAVFLAGKAFDGVTAADGSSAKIKSEDWFDDDCAPHVDATGAVLSSFADWYNYEGGAAKSVTPKTGTFIVRGSKGELYKLEIKSYYSNPDGTEGTTSGMYLLRYAKL